jgi:sec-independent protein translocase protein TatA
MPGFGVGELLLVVLIAFALFGYKRLPAAARSLGRSMRIFKAETRGLAPGDVRGKAEAPTVRNRLGDPVGGHAAPTSADPSGAVPTGAGPSGAVPTSAGPSGAARTGTDPTAVAGDAAGPTG